MKTTLEAKQKYIGKGSSIANELRTEFGDGAGTVVVDCGACDGLDSIIYSNLMPNAKIFAIEPREDNINLINENIVLFKKDNIQSVRACLSDVDGEAEFYESFGQSGNVSGWDTGNKSSSIFRPSGHVREHPWCQFKEPEKIHAQRFDSLGILSVSFLHLDVQGAELKVLEGFGNILSSLRMIWLEIACVELYDGQPLKGDVERYIESKGFKKIIDRYNRREGDQLWGRPHDAI